VLHKICISKSTHSSMIGSNNKVLTMLNKILANLTAHSC
jgi:hypothetical protein